MNEDFVSSWLAGSNPTAMPLTGAPTASSFFGPYNPYDQNNSASQRMDMLAQTQRFNGTPMYQQIQGYMPDMSPEVAALWQKKQAYNAMSPEQQQLARTTGNGYFTNEDQFNLENNTIGSKSMDFQKQALYNDWTEKFNDQLAWNRLNEDNGNMPSFAKQVAADTLNNKTWAASTINRNTAVARPEGNQLERILTSQMNHGLDPGDTLRTDARAHDWWYDQLHPNLQALQSTSGTREGSGMAGQGSGMFQGVTLSDTSNPRGGWGNQGSGLESFQRPSIWGAPSGASGDPYGGWGSGLGYAMGWHKPVDGKNSSLLNPSSFYTPPMSYQDKPAPLDAKTYYGQKGVQQFGQTPAGQASIAGLDLIPDLRKPQLDYSQPGLEKPAYDFSVPSAPAAYGSPQNPYTNADRLIAQGGYKTDAYDWGKRTSSDPNGTEATLEGMRNSSDPYLRQYPPESSGYLKTGDRMQNQAALDQLAHNQAVNSGVDPEAEAAVREITMRNRQEQALRAAQPSTNNGTLEDPYAFKPIGGGKAQDFTKGYDPVKFKGESSDKQYGKLAPELQALTQRGNDPTAPFGGAASSFSDLAGKTLGGLAQGKVNAGSFAQQAQNALSGMGTAATQAVTDALSLAAIRAREAAGNAQLAAQQGQRAVNNTAVDITQSPFGQWLTNPQTEKQISQTMKLNSEWTPWGVAGSVNPFSPINMGKEIWGMSHPQPTGALAGYARMYPDPTWQQKLNMMQKY